MLPFPWLLVTTAFALFVFFEKFVIAEVFEVDDDRSDHKDDRASEPPAISADLFTLINEK